MNRKRVYRLYREAGFLVRRRKRKRIGLVERNPLPKPAAANISWSMDFVSDGLADGRRLRCLNIVDDCTRECVVEVSKRGDAIKASVIDEEVLRIERSVENLKIHLSAFDVSESDEDEHRHSELLVDREGFTLPEWLRVIVEIDSDYTLELDSRS